MHAPARPAPCSQHDPPSSDLMKDYEWSTAHTVNTIEFCQREHSILFYIIVHPIRSLIISVSLVTISFKFSLDCWSSCMLCSRTATLSTDSPPSPRVLRAKLFRVRWIAARLLDLIGAVGRDLIEGVPSSLSPSSSSAFRSGGLLSPLLLEGL